MKKWNETNWLQNTIFVTVFSAAQDSPVIHKLNQKWMLLEERKQRMPTYKVKYSFQNGLSLSLTMLVLFRCNGLLLDMMQYGLMGPLTK